MNTETVMPGSDNAYRLHVRSWYNPPLWEKQMARYIEVCVRDEASTTAKGNILETFAARFLQTQNYDVTERVRLTGMEVDLLAVEKTTGERIFVECKAYRQTVASEVLSKLYGNVVIKGFASGWLISTFDLSKDAKGLRDELYSRSPSERRKLQIYDPSSLIERLISSRLIVNPDTLHRPTSLRFSDDAHLLLTAEAHYWALIVSDRESGIQQSVVLYDAETGNLITKKATISSVSLTDSSLKRLSWETDHLRATTGDAERLTSELQSVVRVQSGDKWADYRPARPQDFVGRDNLLREVGDLFEKVRSHATSTRVFAIKGPSGWGKSSAVLKICDKFGTRKGVGSQFVYAVDSRAATSRRFVELALYRALVEAQTSGFISSDHSIAIGGPNSPFSTDSIRAIFSELRTKRRIICLIFDQFEELLYKEELSPIFADMQALCDAAIDAAENFIVGFSWKTDGAVPPEHNAYHLWHNLSDRRREFELSQFSQSEVSTAVHRFSKELGQAVAPPLRRLLFDHCQGYPWLLKKLCIHILEQVNDGSAQADILLRALKIEELFQRDIEKLGESESDCIKQIASEAPADFFRTVNTFGEVTVSSLLDKRLIVRTGQRLNIYWDIFRDYILTDKVPYIPTTYIPQINVVTYVAAVRFILRVRDATYSELANELRVVGGTVDNLVRDMVIVGHAEANRQSSHLKAIHLDAMSAAAALRQFCESHVLYRRLVDRFDTDAKFTNDEVTQIAAEVYGRLRLSDAVLGQYAQRAMQWCVAAGTVTKAGEFYSLRSAPGGVSGLTDDGLRTRRGRGLFLADVTPERAVAALEARIAAVDERKDQLVARIGQKGFDALASLGLIDNRGSLLVSTSDPAEQIIRNSVSQNPALAVVRDAIIRDPNVTGKVLGEILEAAAAAKWSAATKSRHGNGVRQWVGWTWPQLFFWEGSGKSRRLKPKV